jgi:monoterpene epsilon-lactone hydrolase
MSTQQLESIVEGFRQLYARWTPGTSIAQMRAQWDAFLTQVSIPASVEHLRVGEVPCRWIKAPRAAPDRVIMYLHGGGYQIGSLDSHHNVMARLSIASGCSVLGLSYRLAPEHRFPAALDDALAVYRWVLGWLASARVAVCGDSAGGGLAVALMAAAREDGLSLPAAGALMSPWVDMLALGQSYVENSSTDPVTSRSMILLMAKAYLGRHGDPRDPRASPVLADLQGLPPLFVQAAEQEVLLDDAATLVRRAQAAGVDAELRIYPGMIHVFQLFAGQLDEADDALTDMAMFLDQHIRT